MIYYKLKDYIQLLQDKGLTVECNATEALLEREVCCMTFDNREVFENALFICKGAHFKVDYLLSARDNGAFVYVSETDYNVDGCIPVIVSDIRIAMSYLAKKFYNDCSDELCVVGITGTKGKSTTTYYIKSILDRVGDKGCGVLSSIENYDGVIFEESHLTTPESLVLHKHFHNACSSGIENMIMEVSSQALKYDRVRGVRFNVGCFNNIGTDHISDVEHKDFEDYFQSKLKIFENCETAVINSKTMHFDRVLNAAVSGNCHIVTYGYEPTDNVYCYDVEKKGIGIVFRVKANGEDHRFEISMSGMFNVDNALCAIAVCLKLGIDMDTIKEGLLLAKVPGRMELYQSEDKRVIAVVDYAHNKMSYEALYDSIRIEYPGKSIVTVFGCPGKKAYLRRKDLGEASGQNSDLVIITEEDAGEEDVESICKEIAVYIEREGCPYKIVTDRGEAIRQSILETEGERVIIIAGKGAETRQKRGVLYIDTPSDVDYTVKYLKQYDALTVVKQ